MIVNEGNRHLSTHPTEGRVLRWKSFRNIASEPSLLIVQPLVLPHIAVNALDVRPRFAERNALDPFVNLVCREFSCPATHTGRAAIVSRCDILEPSESVQHLSYISSAEL